MSINPEWAEARNILCLRLDTIGDVLMTTPALRALKESIPGSQITLMTSTRGAEITPLIPEIDKTLVYDAPWMKATVTRTNSLVDHQMIEILKEGKFDAAVIFTVYSQNPWSAATMCYLADIPLRMAYSRENPYQLLTDWVKEIEPEKKIRHEVERHLVLVENIGARLIDQKMRIANSVIDLNNIFTTLKMNLVNIQNPWLVVHPGASALSRRYPADQFAEVVRKLALEDGLQIVFTGDASETGLVDEIQKAAGVDSLSLAGKLSVKELAALLQLAPILLSNNTGPVHIAAAVNTPVVDLYALTNPQHTPWMIPNRVLNHDVPCKYCYRSICPEGHHNCLRLVSPDEVVQAVRELLAETTSGSTEQSTNTEVLG